MIIIVPGDQLALLIGKKGQNIQLVAKLLKADIDVKTPEDAKYEDIQYNHLEIKSLKQRKFDRILEKNRWNNDYSMSGFNKPTKQMNDLMPNTSSTNIVNNEKINKTPKKETKIHSTISLLNKIDNFNYDEGDSSSIEKVDKKPSENKEDILEQLKANNEERQQSSPINDLELNIGKQTTQKQTKTHHKPSKFKSINLNNNVAKEESILEQFKNSDTKSILDELSQENENREQNDDELEFEYEEK